MPEYSHPRPKIISFFQCTCPRCGADKVFLFPITNLKNFTKTKLACENCHLTYQPEPGFFFGAMYWSYAMLVALIITLSILFSVFGNLDNGVYWIPVIIILLLPLIFRYSRMLMLYIVYPVMFRGYFRK